MSSSARKFGKSPQTAQSGATRAVHRVETNSPTSRATSQPRVDAAPALSLDASSIQRGCQRKDPGTGYIPALVRNRTTTSPWTSVPAGSSVFLTSSITSSHSGIGEPWCSRSCATLTFFHQRQASRSREHRPNKTVDLLQQTNPWKLLCMAYSAA